jgi:predicted  nucleic acid-binding Zn-ribbon protein
MPHQCTDCGRTFDDGSKEMLSGCPDCGGNKFQFHPDGVDADPPGGDEPPEQPEPPEPAADSSVARTVGNAATAVRNLVGGDSSGSEPADADVDRPASAESTPPSPESSDPANAATSPESSGEGMAGTEDEAQASARSEVLGPDDFPTASDAPGESTERDLPGGMQNPTTPPSPEPSESEPSESEPSESEPSEPSESAESSQQEHEERPDLSELREELNEQFESIRVLEPGQYELNLMSLYDREEYIIALQEDGKYTIQVPERWDG